MDWCVFIQYNSQWTITETSNEREHIYKAKPAFKINTKQREEFLNQYKTKLTRRRFPLLNIESTFPVILQRYKPEA